VARDLTQELVERAARERVDERILHEMHRQHGWQRSRRLCGGRVDGAEEVEPLPQTKGPSHAEKLRSARDPYDHAGANEWQDCDDA
jgi:hypothetical protein